MLGVCSDRKTESRFGGDGFLILKKILINYFLILIRISITTE
ncbi:hypothetical protein M099_1018 [Phocaeicola vulgatus str. 3975 RP4]|uniref:Uncharacterized protein n=2 Tax=Bacteria TaxID=2 RepID=A0A069SM38_PHOVU|nr:hypothetical protein [uncultured bacterium 33g04]KDS55721.1 hypothetical protein M099_1018 [Phocaeicola vulgatus str. 3975 RP4]